MTKFRDKRLNWRDIPSLQILARVSRVVVVHAPLRAVKYADDIGSLARCSSKVSYADLYLNARSIAKLTPAAINACCYMTHQSAAVNHVRVCRLCSIFDNAIRVSVNLRFIRFASKSTASIIVFSIVQYKVL